MQAILSTTPVNEISKSLEKCKSAREVKEYLMSLDYFCFLKVDKRKKFKPMFEEISIYRQLFTQPLHIAVMHNQFVYEDKGLSKLNIWEYFRNIEELPNDSDEQMPAVPKENRILQEPTLLEVLKVFMENNFNENYYKEITVSNEIGSERSRYVQ